MKNLIAILAIVFPLFAHADDLQLPNDLTSYREELVRAYVKGVFAKKDSKIPGEMKPTYTVTMTHDPEQTKEDYVFRFIRKSPGNACGGIIYQNVAGANELAATDCK